jgi:predicted TPR repeat methyltransferase
MEQLSATDRAVTLDEAISIAIRLQQNEQWAAAADIYRRVLEIVPDFPEAVHFSGVLAHQQGRSEQAIALIERSLELAPDRANWYSNLGIVLKDRLKLEEASAAFHRAIALDPEHANAYSNLGVVLRAQGDVVVAEAAYRSAIRLNPEHLDAYTNLGILLAAQKRIPEAVVCYCKVITLKPSHPDARRLLALAHVTVGEVDKARDIFAEWLKDEPDNPIARHMLAACSGQDVPVRASDSFVETLFDGFAASFDSKLARLSYRAPELVARMLTELPVEPTKSLDVLDAGCGTGLCGPLIAPYARRMAGVDLSARMLAQAEERHVYDELVKGELTAYLHASAAGAFDVIVSADTLVYFGSLDEVVGAAAHALRPGGRLIFTVEECVDPSVELRISPHGRYTHTRAYVERVLATANLRPEIVGAELRTEGGAPVAGLVVRATKAPDAEVTRA